MRARGNGRRWICPFATADHLSSADVTSRVYVNIPPKAKLGLVSRARKWPEPSRTTVHGPGKGRRSFRTAGSQTNGINIQVIVAFPTYIHRAMPTLQGEKIHWHCRRPTCSQCIGLVVGNEICGPVPHAQGSHNRKWMQHGPASITCIVSIKHIVVTSGTTLGLAHKTGSSMDYTIGFQGTTAPGAGGHAWDGFNAGFRGGTNPGDPGGQNFV
jgi:hypothetical protein